jgi:ribonuclease HI
MLVTIIADASYCPDTGAAGYGFWIASARGRRSGSGSVRQPVTSSISAEMMAMVNGFHQACVWGLIQPKDSLLLQTDCQSAIHAFQNMRFRMSTEEVAVVARMRLIAATYDVETSFRHVKGHTSGKTPRTWVNNECDRLAGAAMRVTRERLRGERAAQAALEPAL